MKDTSSLWKFSACPSLHPLSEQRCSRAAIPLLFKKKHDSQRAPASGNAGCDDIEIEEAGGASSAVIMFKEDHRDARSLGHGRPNRPNVTLHTTAPVRRHTDVSISEVSLRVASRVRCLQSTLLCGILQLSSTPLYHARCMVLFPNRSVSSTASMRRYRLVHFTRHPSNGLSRVRT